MIKELIDYLDIIESKYPHIPREELRKVIEYGFSSFYLLVKLNADIQLHNRKFSAYCGKLFIDNYKRTIYNYFKYKTKLRLKYRYAQETYNGMYYFGLTNEEWELYKSKIESKKHRNIKFINLKLYKIKEECFLNKERKHFFILNYPVDVGWSFTLKEITTKSFKYFAYRDAKNQIVTIQ